MEQRTSILTVLKYKGIRKIAVKKKLEIQQLRQHLMLPRQSALNPQISPNFSHKPDILQAQLIIAKPKTMTYNLSKLKPLMSMTILTILRHRTQNWLLPFKQPYKTLSLIRLCKTLLFWIMTRRQALSLSKGNLIMALEEWSPVNGIFIGGSIIIHFYPQLYWGTRPYLGKATPHTCI